MRSWWDAGACVMLRPSSLEYCHEDAGILAEACCSGVEAISGRVVISADRKDVAVARETGMTESRRRRILCGMTVE